MGIGSCRRLEQACRDHLPLLWLTGCQVPDHNTLWRFFRDHRQALQGLFGQSVKTAVAADLVGVVLHAMDGTKMGSRHGRAGLRERATLERFVTERSAEIEASMAQEPEPTDEGYRLPAELKDREALRQRIAKAKAALAEPDQPKLVNPDEPEARMMRFGGGGIALGYNAQAVVDADSGLIVAQQVANIGTDYSALAPMLERVVEQLGRTAETTVADSGYCSAEGLAQAEPHGHDVLVRLPRTLRPDPEKPYAAAQFTWDEANDSVVCPRGQTLVFLRQRTKPDRTQPVREYRCQSFRDCPVRDACSKDPQGRRVEISPHEAALRRQRARHQLPDAADKLARRAGIVEHVFGWIKHNLGWRRFTHGGLHAASTQWALLCTTCNLQKLFRSLWLNPQPS